MKRHLRFRLCQSKKILLIHCLSIFGFRNNRKKKGAHRAPYDLVESGGVEPPCFSYRILVLQRVVDLLVPLLAPVDRLRSGVLGNFSAWLPQRSVCLSQLSDVEKPKNEQLAGFNGTALSGECERFVVCDYLFADIFTSDLRARRAPTSYLPKSNPKRPHGAHITHA